MGIAAALTAAGESSMIFTPTGPASVLALFKTSTQVNAYVFFGEFFANVFLAIVVACVLDASNVFVVCHFLLQGINQCIQRY